MAWTCNRPSTRRVGFSGEEGMQVERGYSQGVRAELAAMGHQVSVPHDPIGGAQAILIDDSGC